MAGHIVYAWAMARPRSAPGGRPRVVAVRLSEEEWRDLEARRGSLDKAAFLRWLLVQARKSDVRFGATRPK